MIDETHRRLSEESEAFSNRLRALPEHISAIWKTLVGDIRSSYVMDEAWDGETVTFQRDGVILCALTLTPSRVSARIGEAVVELATPAMAEEVMRQLRLTRQPDRTLSDDECSPSVCGCSCGICSLSAANRDLWPDRDQLVYSFAKCFGGDQDMRGDACPGCKMGKTKGIHGGGCVPYSCASERGVDRCGDCRSLTTCANVPDLHPGSYPPGLTAFEVTHIALPYVNRYYRSGNLFTE